MPLAGCRIFDGIDDHAETATALDLSPYSAVTVLARVWWEVWGGLSLVFEHSNATGQNAGGFMIGNWYNGEGTWAVFMSSSGTYPTLPVHQRNVTVPPTLNAWHSLGVLLNRAAAGHSEIMVYLDGVLVETTWIENPDGAPAGMGTDDCTGPFANQRFFLMSQQGTSGFGKGRLADVAIYGEALSASEQYIYALGNQADSFGTPIAYWPLEGVDSPEPDLAGSHPLTVVGTTQGPPPPSAAPTLAVSAGHVTIGGNGSLFVGEDKILALMAPLGADGVPVNLVGASVQFDVRTSDSATEIALSKTASIAGTYSATRASNTQRVLVVLTDTETATLTGGQVYRHSWKRQDAGAEQVLAYGYFFPERATQA